MDILASVGVAIFFLLLRNFVKNVSDIMQAVA
jgi:hypothetical protein